MPSFKNAAKYILPPVLWDSIKWLRDRLSDTTPQQPALEYMPEGWRRQATDPKVKGWNVESVLAAHQASWPGLVKALESSKPLGIAPEARRITNDDFFFHNTLMCYAYVLTLTARNKDAISILDWGGGLGQYYLIGKAVLPDVELKYTCKELPILAEYGQRLLPQVTFLTDERYLNQTYDLVMASGALQYVEDWRTTLQNLASVTGRYLYITRIPVVHNTSSFVVLQRPYKIGYDTEYLMWYLNQDELVENAQSAGLELIREFLITGEIPTQNAPEQAAMRGFLFRSTPSATANR